jgi:NTP pyrophosphatase (non-canonical NTP hydrolase)
MSDKSLQPTAAGSLRQALRVLLFSQRPSLVRERHLMFFVSCIYEVSSRDRIAKDRSRVCRSAWPAYGCQPRLLDLVSEVGELAKEALKTSAYGTQPFLPTTAWTEELGDVLFALLCVAHASEVDVEEALKRVIEKYRDRLSSGGSASSER